MSTRVSLDTWRRAKFFSRCLHACTLLTFVGEVWHDSASKPAAHKLFSPLTKHVAMMMASIFLVLQGLGWLLATESEACVLLPTKLWKTFVSDLFVAVFISTCFVVAHVQECANRNHGLSPWAFAAVGTMYLIITAILEYDTRDANVQFLNKLGRAKSEEKIDPSLLFV